MLTRVAVETCDDDDCDDCDEKSGGDRRVDGGVLGAIVVVLVVGCVARRVVVINENVGLGEVVVDGRVGGWRRVVSKLEIVTSLSLMKLLLRSNHSSKRFVYFPVGSYFSARAVEIRIINKYRVPSLRADQ